MSQSGRAHPMFVDLVGQRFGRLVVTDYSHCDHRGALWLCVCDCSKPHLARSWNLRSGKTRSCGCLRVESRATARKTHGCSRTAMHNAWYNMLRRCTEQDGATADAYSKRGITVCERWQKFENFLSDMPPRPTPKHSIDRINNDKGYSPDNCRWATKREQSLNTRRARYFIIDGIRVPAMDVAARNGITNSTFRVRLHRGWDLAAAAGGI
jgi:hypothetical protein